MSRESYQLWFRLHIAGYLVAFALAGGMYFDPVRTIFLTEPMTVAEVRSMFAAKPFATLTGPLIRWTIVYFLTGAFILYAFIKSELALREAQG